ncbi:hypothetical protein [Nostoc sp.]|uniref:hypothetical protein n=1 Tax=Nostoc sp. TaxID=1180 RepID=UPI002FFC875E
MTGMEPLVIAAAASAVSGVAVPIFQSLWGGGGKLLGLFGKTLNEETSTARRKSKVKSQKSKVLWNGLFRDFKWLLYLRRGVLGS